jgi:hypothetical protein
LALPALVGIAIALAIGWQRFVVRIHARREAGERDFDFAIALENLLLIRAIQVT